MLKRRVFFKQAGVFAVGSLLLPACATKDKNAETSETGAASDTVTETGTHIEAIGVQLYSVRDIIEQDVKGVLRQLADMGYKEIEAYPGSKGHFFGFEPKEFGDMISGMGMTLISSHVGSGTRSGKADSWRQATLLTRFDELAAKAAETGQEYLTCSWMDESLRKTSEDLAKTAELFNKTGEICKKSGLQFAYHNHAFEYEKVGDTMIYDYMLENTDPDLVKWELDMYWVVAGGQDPITYLKKYPNRFPLGHVKDMDKTNKENNTELGKGSIDYKEILKVAKENGMEHFLVEQETYTNSSIESVKEDYQYLANVTI